MPSAIESYLSAVYESVRCTIPDADLRKIEDYIKKNYLQAVKDVKQKYFSKMMSIPGKYSKYVKLKITKEPNSLDGWFYNQLPIDLYGIVEDYDADPDAYDEHWSEWRGEIDAVYDELMNELRSMKIPVVEYSTGEDDIGYTKALAFNAVTVARIMNSNGFNITIPALDKLTISGSNYKKNYKHFLTTRAMEGVGMAVVGILATLLVGSEIYTVINDKVQLRKAKKELASDNVPIRTRMIPADKCRALVDDVHLAAVWVSGPKDSPEWDEIRKAAKRSKETLGALPILTTYKGYHKMILMSVISGLGIVEYRNIDDKIADLEQHRAMSDEYKYDLDTVKALDMIISDLKKCKTQKMSLVVTR